MTHAELDLSGIKCPMNFVKTKIKLDTMEAGQILLVKLEDDGESKDSVTNSVIEEGHSVISAEKDDERKMWNLEIAVRGYVL